MSDLVVNEHFAGGTKVHSIDGTTIRCDTTSTNTSAASNQVVKFLDSDLLYRTVATKSILVAERLPIMKVHR